MKLIRLATDNDAKFDANFDTPIEIKKDSKMALLNLTLEKAFVEFNINVGNNFVNGKYPDDTLLDGNDAYIQTVNIDTFDEVDEALHKISRALNDTLQDSVKDVTTIDHGVYGGAEWIVRKNPKDALVEIMLHLAPLIPPLLKVATSTPGMPNAQQSVFEDITTTGADALLTKSNAIGSGLSAGDRFHLVNGTVGVTDRSYCYTLSEGLSFSKGSGCIAFQIEDSNDNGTGGGAGSTNNGFGIGLCIGVENVPLNNTGRLTDADVDYEVYFNRSTENYSAIVGKGNARAVSGITPLKTTLAAHTNAATHDYLGIFFEDGIIVGFVAKDAGTDIEFFDPYQPTDEELLNIQKHGIQAYFYFSDDDTAIKVCNARTTCSPYVTKGQFRNEDDTASFNGFKDLAVPGLSDNQYNSLPYRFDGRNALRCGALGRFTPNRVTQDFNITLDQGIQEYLGFDSNERIVNTRTNIVKNGVFRKHASQQINFNFSDFYIVESQSLAIDSYNAVPDERIDQNVNRQQALKAPLKGDRKNILATIPINEGAGQVEYETNTPQFIDIRNLSDTNIRNLKFRILDKNFNEIVTSNTTNMTIVVKSPDE